MIISLMHIHLAENVKLTSRRVEFWEADLGFFRRTGKIATPLHYWIQGSI